MSNHAQPETDAPALGGMRLAVGAVAVSLAIFMNILDTTIANVAIPTIAGDMGVSPAQGTWIVTSYAVALAASLPAAHWLAVRVGQVRAFVGSVLLFALTSLFCGLAEGYGSLVIARALQGAAAGPMIPLSQVLLLRAFPRAKSSQALAVWSMTATLAPVFGPVLGGLIIDRISWPWIFFINVPVALLAALGAGWILRRHETPARRAKLDWWGLILLLIFAGALQIALDTGQEQDWFHSNVILVLMAIAALGSVAFIVRELLAADPLVELRLFAERNFLVGTVVLSMGYAICFASIVIIPIWLQLYMGYTATWAGAAMAPVGLCGFLLAPVVGRLLPRVDTRLVVTFSMLVLAGLSWARAHLSTSASFLVLAMPQLALGVVMATLMAPLMGLALSNVAVARLAAASGLIGFLRILAGAFAVAIGTALWHRRATLHRANLSEHIGSYDPDVATAFAALETAGVRPLESLALVDQQLTVQSRMLALNDLSLASAAAALALIVLVWFARRVRRGFDAAGTGV